MLVILACALLLVMGCALAWRWRHFELALPHWAAEDTRSVGRPARALVWLLGIGLLTGLLIAVLVVGPAGRLAMRLLALTSPDAQGMITEAGEVVGNISLTGTIGLFVFVGLPFGLIGGVGYVLASLVLSRGPVGGAIFGVAMLICVGSRVAPLHEENPDFDILGPGWLSIVTFSVMAVLTGILTAPIAGRIGAALQTLKGWWAVWMVPAGLVLLATLVTAPLALVAFLVGCLVIFAAVLMAPTKNDYYRRRGRLTTQLALALIVAISLPGFVVAISDIAS